MNLDVIYRLFELTAVIIGIGGILYRLGGMTKRFEMIGSQQASEIRELKESVRELAKVTNRMERLEERQLQEGKRFDLFEARFNKFINGVH